MTNSASREILTNIKDVTSEYYSSQIELETKFLHIDNEFDSFDKLTLKLINDQHIDCINIKEFINKSIYLNCSLMGMLSTALNANKTIHDLIYLGHKQLKLTQKACNDSNEKTKRIYENAETAYLDVIKNLGEIAAKSVKTTSERSKGGSKSFWQPHEEVILRHLKNYHNNRCQSQEKTINNIVEDIYRTSANKYNIPKSTFNNWYKSFKNNSCEYIFKNVQ